MDLFVFAAVLFSAFFQASWNFAAKRSKANKIALLAVGWFLFGILLLPIALFVTPFEEATSSWLLYMGASGLIHAAYICLLGWGYTVGEISVVYPIARGLGIVGTTLLSLALGLHSLSVTGAFGILSVICGTILIGWKELPDREKRTALLAAALIAVTVSGYSVVDSLGAKQVPVFLYIVGMNLFAPLFAAPFLFLSMRAEMAATFRSHKVEALLVALAGSLAYGIVLWAFQRSATAYVAALREFSVVIAAVLGIVFLNERIYKRKLLAIAAILLGLVLIKLA